MQQSTCKIHLITFISFKCKIEKPISLSFLNNYNSIAHDSTRMYDVLCIFRSILKNFPLYFLYIVLFSKQNKKFILGHTTALVIILLKLL